MAIIYNKLTGNKIVIQNEDVIRTLSNDKDYIVKDSDIELDTEIHGEKVKEEVKSQAPEVKYNAKMSAEELKKRAELLGIDTEGLTKKEILAVLDRETKNA